ncbi:sodium:proton antiporter [Melioribacteraceae bacterium 4301-Me]|uniref:sodium:proton antiporter n=1 Tax=Pyranulibacter aquaticus TaxID=3163344 RepID=UPI00359BC895
MRLLKKVKYIAILLVLSSGLTLAVDSSVLENTSNLPEALMVIPFFLLLLMIATGPLFYRHFWEHHYPKIAILLGSITVIYYLFFLKDTHSLLHTLAEYISFIALLSSLFVASGGILIKIDRKSTPLLNSIILFIGAILANIIGTTGASMLLIRPFIKINKNRIKAYHIIFFIFIVSNIGGALTPIGDPPLFLGFLRGIDFFWFSIHIWYIWLPAILLLLAIFFFIDAKNIFINNKESYFTGKFELKGTKNLLYLLVILISVFIDPNIFSWVPNLSPLPFGVREIIMFTVVYLSYKNADKNILMANEFDFEPIKEVAYLFAGIFATMIPALQLIAYEAKILGDKLNPGSFYWATGILSALLDNAPTYLNFLSAELGKYGLNVNLKSDVQLFQHLYPVYLQSISIAAVFFGAMTYIGNGPNFMVKSISERAGIEMPSFFGYMVKYSIPILLPVFLLIWYVLYA